MLLKLVLHNPGPDGGMYVWVNTDQISTMHERFGSKDGKREFSFTEVRVVEQGRWVTHQVPHRADDIAGAVNSTVLGYDTLTRDPTRLKKKD